MPSTRRRFLAGCALAAGPTVAGCSDDTDPAPELEETLTPVEVPRSDREILAEAADLDAPSIPSAIVVTDDHLEAAATEVESAIAEVEDLNAEADRDQVDVDVPDAADVEWRVHAAGEVVEDVRSDGPSRDGLSSLRQVLEDMGELRGILRTVTGRTDLGAIQEAIDRQRGDERDLRHGIDYRIAEPVGEHLPTRRAAWETLATLDGLQDAAELLDGADQDAEQHPRRIGDIERVRVRHERRLDDAERWLETSSDPGAPPIADGIAAELVALHEEAERIGAEHAGEDDAGDSLADRIDAVRVRIGRRGVRIAEELDGLVDELDGRADDGDAFESTGDGDGEDAGALARVRGVETLLNGLEWLVEYEAVDVAAERTIDQVGDREFPTPEVLEAKRRAVERIEHVAGASPIERHLARRSTVVVDHGDGHPRRDVADLEAVAYAHFVYTAAAEWADRGAASGGRLSDRLQAEQS